MFFVKIFVSKTNYSDVNRKIRDASWKIHQTEIRFLKRFEIEYLSKFKFILKMSERFYSSMQNFPDFRHFYHPIWKCTAILNDIIANCQSDYFKSLYIFLPILIIFNCLFQFSRKIGSVFGTNLKIKKMETFFSANFMHFVKAAITF